MAGKSAKTKIVRFMSNGESFVGPDWLMGSQDALIDTEGFTAQEIGQVCDDVAENENYHELVGGHLGLAHLIEKVAGPEIAARVLLEIAERGTFLDLDGYDGTN